MLPASESIFFFTSSIAKSFRSTPLLRNVCEERSGSKTFDLVRCLFLIRSTLFSCEEFTIRQKMLSVMHLTRKKNSAWHMSKKKNKKKIEVLKSIKFYFCINIQNAVSDNYAIAKVAFLHPLALRHSFVKIHIY